MNTLSIFEKDTTETISEIADNMSAFLQNIVEFVEKFIDYLNKYFADGGELGFTKD